MKNYKDLSDFMESKGLVEEPFINYGQVQKITQSGFPVYALKVFADRLEMTNKELQKIMAMSQSTFSRRMSSNRLTKEESERFFQISGLYKKGLDVFNNEADFLIWLRTFNPSLNNQKPIELMSSLSGIKEVEESLSQIEYGVYS